MTRSIGTANPTPELWSALPSVAIWSAMPTTLPSASSTGPPELPGFIAASVWIACATVKPLGAWMVRSTPETMPVLRLRSYPNGSPMAATGAPTPTDAELPSASGCSVRPEGSTVMTATSVASSWPSTVALRVVPSWNFTVTDVAPSTTWAAVTMWPLPSTTKPVPLAVVCDWGAAPPKGVVAAASVDRLCTVMSTTPGAVLAYSGLGIEAAGGRRRAGAALDDGRRARRVAADRAGGGEDPRRGPTAQDRRGDEEHRERAPRRAPRPDAPGAPGRRGREARRRGRRRPTAAATPRTGVSVAGVMEPACDPKPRLS